MVSVKMVIMNHLNDAQIEMTFNPELSASRLKFVKFLVFKYPDTNVELTRKELNDLWNEATK